MAGCGPSGVVGAPAIGKAASRLLVSCGIPIGGAGGGGRMPSPAVGIKFISGTPLISGVVDTVGALATAGLSATSG